jgi:hypothetical protein
MLPMFVRCEIDDQIDERKGRPMKKRRRHRPMALRMEARRQLIARLMLCRNWNAKQIARRLHTTARVVRYEISSAEFATVYADLQREYFQQIDRATTSVWRAALPEAIETLRRLLHHKDWRARQAAAELILGGWHPVLEAIAAGRLDPHHSTGATPELVLDEVTRAQVREALTLYRQQLPPRQLPPRLTNGTSGEARDSEN